MDSGSDSITSSTAPERKFPVWQVLVGGFGLAAIGAGVAFKLDSRAAEQNLVDHCGETLVCKRASGYDPAEDNERKNRGFGLFVGATTVGTVAIGAAVIGIIARPRAAKSEAPSVVVTPSLSPTFGGASFSGRF
jgi:hypothetical protein